MISVIRYTEQEFDEISKYFKAELDDSIIKDLLEIKRNNRFIKRKSPIRLKYIISNAWRNSSDKNKDLDENELLPKLITSNLNKLSPENFELIYKDISEIIDKFPNVNISTTIDLIFDKSLEEQFYSLTYSKLLSLIVKKHSNSDYITEKCKIFFNNFIEKNIEDISENTDYDELCSLNIERNNILGGIILISNLYSEDIISYQSVKTYYLRLISKLETCNKNNSSIFIESLVEILNNAGKLIFNTYPDEFNEIFLNNVHNLLKNKDIMKPKYKFKIYDTLDLIKNNWNQL